MTNEKKDPGRQFGLQIDEPTFVEKLPTEVSPNLPKPLSLEEKKFLLSVERGDQANVRRIIQLAHRKKQININCVDSLGRGALTLAIDNENLEMVELLVIMGVETSDALLQAINAEFVEAVELLLEHEELIHKEGEQYSWQKTDINTAMFTPDITPLMLAAHRNNYEIIKILLDRGATLPMPHDVKCGCAECIQQTNEDSLRHSLSRVNEYRALASPSLIALSSNDPLLTAFQLSWEMRNLAFAEQECKSEYLELRRKCQQFAVDLLDQSRNSQELAIILNYDPGSPPYEDGDHMTLRRLELAINYKQKKFVAHPNIQQLLAAMWYEGVPGFRRKSPFQKLTTIATVAILFPLYCTIYMISPNSNVGKLMRKPFMKFLVHSSSYIFFLLILILVSQRVEVHLIQMFGTENMQRELQEQLMKQRGSGPTPLELVIVVYVLGFIWEETQEIYVEGIQRYLRNMWNFIDFTRNFLYCIVGLLRIIAYIQQSNEVKRDPSTAYIAREHWDDFDPQLIAEGLFAAANIFSALKLVHMFSINPHLGPLQISLGRMVIDIVKFFFIYTLVLFAFACGLNQLLWYFADLEKKKCYVLPGGEPDWDNASDSCMKWRRFGNLFESSQSLFWASFGMVGLETFELTGIKTYTRFWGLLMFGSYSVINVIVLLNLLIAMMSNSYAMIDEQSDTEWKFARTKLWMSYFEESSTLPPPFNIFPTPKKLMKLCRSKAKRTIKQESTIRRKEERDRDNRYTNVMRSLVWRYVSAMHRRMEEDAVTEDDINEVKGEISSMRYEILEIFEKNGMDVSSANRKEKTVLAKRMKIWERRLMKDFQVAPVPPEENEDDNFEIPANETAVERFRRVARKIARNSCSYKWGQVMQGVGVMIPSQIGRCHNRSSFKNQQNLKKAMAEAKRLVEKSTALRSGAISPIEMVDSGTSNLIELLKKISEECNEISPGNTLTVTQSRSRAVSPNLQLLHKQLHSAISSQSDKSSQSTTFFKTQNLEKPPQNTSKVPPFTIVSISPPPVDENVPSSTHSSALYEVDSPLLVENSTETISCKSPLPSIQSLPPIIKITSTESPLSQSDDNEDDALVLTEPSITPKPLQETTKESQDPQPPPSPMKSIASSPSKFVKRRPSTPPPTEIAVSRPIGTKPQPGQGMIPPPPPPPTPLPPTYVYEIQPQISSKQITSPSSPVHPSSLSSLRPSRKIEDTKPFKRVPKTGWL